MNSNDKWKQGSCPLGKQVRDCSQALDKMVKIYNLSPIYIA